MRARHKRGAKLWRKNQRVEEEEKEGRDRVTVGEEGESERKRKIERGCEDSAERRKKRGGGRDSAFDQTVCITKEGTGTGVRTRASLPRVPSPRLHREEPEEETGKSLEGKEEEECGDEDEEEEDEDKDKGKGDDEGRQRRAERKSMKGGRHFLTLSKPVVLT